MRSTALGGNGDDEASGEGANGDESMRVARTIYSGLCVCTRARMHASARTWREREKEQDRWSPSQNQSILCVTRVLVRSDAKRMQVERWGAVERGVGGRDRKSKANVLESLQYFVAYIVETCSTEGRACAVAPRISTRIVRVSDTFEPILECVLEPMGAWDDAWVCIIQDKDATIGEQRSVRSLDCPGLLTKTALF